MGTMASVASMIQPVRLRPVEWATIIYLSTTSLIFAAFRHNLSQWGFHLSAHAGATMAVLLLAWFQDRYTNPGLRFLRLWSPLLIFIGCFEEIERAVHVIFPGWFDAILIQADYALFGAHPTVWLEKYSNIWLNDYMQFSYTSYFLLTPILGGVLYWRAEWRRFDLLMLSTALSYYLCYFIALLFPIEGPYHTLRHLQTVELHGWYFTALINWIEGFGRVHGGAFPSAHVAGSTVALLCAYRYLRRLFWILLPIILSLFVSTVYGRYHYAGDVIAGFGIGVLGFFLARIFCEEG